MLAMTPHHHHLAGPGSMEEEVASFKCRGIRLGQGSLRMEAGVGEVGEENWEQSWGEGRAWDWLGKKHGIKKQ